MGRDLTREHQTFLVTLLASAAGAVLLMAVLNVPDLWVVAYIVAVQMAIRVLTLIEFDLGQLLMSVRVRRAIAAGQIVMHYQPKVSLLSGELLGVEALARWEHPRRGLLAPAEWLAGAEVPWTERRFMRHTLEAALAQARRWREEHGLDILVCVNVTPHCFSDPSFPAQLQACMERTQTHNTQVQIELTEAGLGLSDHAVAVAERLNEMGVGLALDDFGVGHASMDRLVRLPISELKIDRRFVMRQATSARDAAIVEGAINLAKALGLSVTAEGVETHRDVESLTRNGCDTAQGYYYSRALAADELLAWMASYTATAAPPHPPASRIERRQRSRRRDDRADRRSVARS